MNQRNTKNLSEEKHNSQLENYIKIKYPFRENKDLDSD